MVKKSTLTNQQQISQMVNGGHRNQVQTRTRRGDQVKNRTEVTNVTGVHTCVYMVKKSTLMNQQQVSHLVNGDHRQHVQTRWTYFKQYFCELFWQQYDRCREADLGGLIETWRSHGLGMKTGEERPEKRTTSMHPVKEKITSKETTTSLHLVKDETPSRETTTSLHPVKDENRRKKWHHCT